MRRPLFGNGIPQSALGNEIPLGSPMTILDLATLDPSQVYAVTLYAWPWTTVLDPAPAAGEYPVLLASVQTQGGASAIVGQTYEEVFVAQANAVLLNGESAAPLKILDQYLVRGQQKLVLENANPANTAANSRSCFVFGYFELAGEMHPPLPFRPLQPSNTLVAPFNAAPAVVNSPVNPPPGNPTYATAHMLSADYLDELNLNANILGITGAYGAGVVAFLKLPGGVKLPLPAYQDANHPLLLSKVFDGIPLRAPSSSDNLIQVGFDANVLACGVAAFGSFFRH
jgi:hypothetical protein